MSATTAKKRGSLRKTLNDLFPGIGGRTKQLTSGDRVEFKKGEEQLLVCCRCGDTHLVYFDKDCTMTIWDPLVLLKKK